jgi:hypothetical protein
MGWRAARSPQPSLSNAAGDPREEQRFPVRVSVTSSS